MCMLRDGGVSKVNISGHICGYIGVSLVNISRYICMYVCMYVCM
jgi:hypothetical protein